MAGKADVEEQCGRAVAAIILNTRSWTEMKRLLWVWIGLAGYMLSYFTGCAFDLMHVKYTPASFDHNASSERVFTLKENVALTDMPCNYDRTLLRDKRWQLISHIEQGEVFKPIDQSFLK
jgi:hypothetical protein